MLKNVVPAKDTPLISFLHEAFQEMPDFFESLVVLDRNGLLYDREKMGEAIIALQKKDYLPLYKRLSGLGFTPNLNQDAINTDKEKYRVASFLIRNLQSIEREVTNLFENPQLSH